jgi:hypothetical protein
MDPFLGSLVLGAGSQLFGNFLGQATSGPGFQPSPGMAAVQDYGVSMVEPPRWKKKADKAEFRSLRQAGDRGAAEDLFRTLAELYPNEKLYSKKLAKSLKKDVDFSQNQSAWNVADQVYKNAGLTFTPEEYQDLAYKAKTSGVRGSSAFGDFLKQNLIAQGKVRTPQEEALDLIFGRPGKDPKTGVYLGRETLLRGPVTGPSQNVVAPVTYQYGA